MDEIEAFSDGDRAMGGDLAGDLGGTGSGLVGNLVDQTECQGFLCGEDAAGERKLERAALAHGGGHGIVHKEGPEAEADFGETEGSVGRDNRDVAVRDKPGAAGERGPADRSDDRGVEAGAEGE